MELLPHPPMLEHSDLTDRVRSDLLVSPRDTAFGARFERERTCPLCRTLIKPDGIRSYADGSTNLVFQLF
ncbi:hypothetical protein QQP08_024987 [Theobroma cacao]|nr:hypothetical protein QQP08_024987 [Theobroma cacao]